MEGWNTEIKPNAAGSYYNRAIANYDKVIEIDPNYARAYYNRGVCKYNLKDIIGACKDARKAKQFGYKFKAVGSGGY